MADPIVNTVDPTQLRIAQAQGTLPSSAADDSGREPVSSSPVNGQLQPPTQAPAQQSLQLQPSQSITTPAQPPTSNQRLFGFLGHVLSGTLSALAGRPPVTYETGPDGKIRPSATQPKDTIGAQGRRLAAHALEGLSVQVPPQKSGLATGLAGLGAGFTAAQNAGREQDAQARQKAREDFEAQQKTILQKHNVALGNAAMMSHYWDMRKQGIEMLQPTYDSHKALGDALSEAGLQVPTMFAEEANKLREADPHFLANNIILPVGQAPVTDAQGNQLFGPNESGDQVVPLMHERVIVVPAAHTNDATGATKVQIPSALADEIHQYAPLGGGSGYEQIKSGNEFPLSDLSPILTQMQLGRKASAAGWQEKTPGENAALDKDGNIVQRNPASGETRPYKGGAPLQAQERLGNIGKKGEDTKEAKLRQDLTGAQIDETKARTKKLNQEADQEKLFNLAGSGNLTGEAYLKTLPLAQQQVLKAIAEGRDTRSPRQLQGKDGNPTPLAEALHRAYPDFDDKKAAAYGAVVKDFTSGPTSRGLTAYGTAINHARALYDNTDLKSFIPGTDEYKRYNQDITYVATEGAKALNPTGVATEGAIREQEDALRSYTNRKAAIENAEHILTGKMAEVKQRWLNAQVRPSYQPPMPGLSKEAMDNADYIRNHGKVQPAQNPQTGHSNLPPGASHVGKDANGNIVGYVLNGQWVSVGGKQ